MSFLNRLVPFYFCIHFTLLVPASEPLFGLFVHCLNKTCISRWWQRRLWCFGVSSVLPAGSSARVSLPTVKHLANACETQEQWVLLRGCCVLQPSPVVADRDTGLALVPWPFPTPGPALQEKQLVPTVGARSWPSEDGAVVPALYTTEENLDVFPSRLLYLKASVKYLFSTS